MSEREINKFWSEQISGSTGERRRRLKQGPGHAEKVFLKRVWLPAFGHFTHLTAECEVPDVNGKSRFIDFVYTPGILKIGIELEGYGPHWRDISRWRFSDELRRFNQFMIEGWLMLRFSYDDIQDHPRICEQTITSLLGKWTGATAMDDLTARERDLVRWAVKWGKPFTPGQIALHTGITRRSARSSLHRLVELGVMVPVSGNQRIRSYRINGERPVLF